MELSNRHKAQFELMNNSLWLLIKGYVKDESVYKKIMSDLFFKFVEYDLKDDKLADSWWEIVNKDFMVYPEGYKDTELKDFVGELAIGYCDFWEREKKYRYVGWYDFYTCISLAFVNEWGRLKYEQDNQKG